MKKTAEEILKSKLDTKILIINNADYTFNKIIEAMEEYAAQCQEYNAERKLTDKIFDLANELAVAGHGNEACQLHSIHNKLNKNI